MKEIETVYTTFFEEKEVVEIRAFGLNGRTKAWEGWAGRNAVVYGYFDNATDFAKCAASLDQLRAQAVYFTLNPVDPRLIARCMNRLKVSTPKEPTTSDKDIVRIRWIPIDIDPVRPAGISSSQEELEKAFGAAKEIIEWMESECGMADPVKGCSGNGAHLCYRIDGTKGWENTQESVEQVKKILNLLYVRFSDPSIHVDTSVYNPARIWKIYGTRARKGDHHPDRPHRKSYLIQGEKSI